MKKYLSGNTCSSCLSGACTQSTSEQCACHIVTTSNCT